MVDMTSRPRPQLRVHAAGGGELLPVPEGHAGRLLPAARDEQTVDTRHAHTAAGGAARHNSTRPPRHASPAGGAASPW